MFAPGVRNPHMAVHAVELFEIVAYRNGTIVDIYSQKYDVRPPKGEANLWKT